MRIRHNNLLALVMITLGVAILSPLFYIISEASVNPKLSLSDLSGSDEANISDFVDDVNEELNSKNLTYKDGTRVKNFQLFDGSSGRSDSTLEIRKSTTNEYGEPIVGYNDLSEESKSEVLQTAFSMLDSSNISRSNKVKIYNFIYKSDENTSSIVRQLSSDVRGDYYGGYSWLKKLHVPQFISKVIGFMVVLIFALLAITITLDLAYINIPLFQVFLDDKEVLRRRLVSIEAQQAVDRYGGQQSISQNRYTYKLLGSNKGEQDLPIVYYLRNKSKQLSVLFICILYLVSGQIYNGLANLADYFIGLLGA